MTETERSVALQWVSTVPFNGIVLSAKVSLRVKM